MMAIHNCLSNLHRYSRSVALVSGLTPWHLSYWDGDKCPPHCRKHFKCLLLSENYDIFIQILFLNLSQDSAEQLTNLGSDNGLSPNRQQAIIWTNDSIVSWRIYMSHGSRKTSGNVREYAAFSVSICFWLGYNNSFQMIHAHNLPIFFKVTAQAPRQLIYDEVTLSVYGLDCLVKRLFPVRKASCTSATLTKCVHCFYIPVWKTVVLCRGDIRPSEFARLFSTRFEISNWNLVYIFSRWLHLKVEFHHNRVTLTYFTAS